MNRRALLKAAAIGTGGFIGTGTIAGVTCKVSHIMKLHAIRGECDTAMKKYEEEKQSGASTLVGLHEWTQQTGQTLDEKFVDRSWKAGGTRAQGSLNYLLGDFEFDKVQMPSCDNNKKIIQKEKWLGRCGCLAKYGAVEAARNGFADVRMYFASHPKQYQNTCPLSMHYYAVVGNNDVNGFDNRFFVLMKNDQGKYTFKEMEESEIDDFLEDDFRHGNVKLCMQSKRPIILPAEPPPMMA